ncbi:hypothetical protein, variant [Sphaeroforma arctica JP610]|uniref:Uncharacterized protein n=1 Tax=Sphaeroforma arctica JP610 TaxID=667725 RepID=A0A0L0FRT2_9EUKA|nr:hypothetical protein, variant [Sphaeroforma arctica JP610]KNC79281.1 hypothetical protein, variant [Sphaeroforma arctica JP610]|eukprot:XP_014153183.1 hypothetical protein, variant [Sphaeroforma arctica JP610]
MKHAQGRKNCAHVGLLPFLKGAMVTGHVDVFRDQVVAVDAYSWLHRGAYSCARELADGTPTDRYLSFSRKRITMLRSHKVEPLLVFDGRSLPSKAVTDNDRRQRRTTNRALAEKALREGKNAEANIMYQRCISITPALAFALIQMCREMHVRFIVAPYEADSQMAFLATTNRVAAIITEDSDLIAFGCSKIIYKLEPTGMCVMYDKELLKDDKAIGVPMSTFSDTQLLEMCILSGCDYLPSVTGMGIKTAFKYIKQFGTAHQAIRRLRASNKFTIPSTYPVDFARALQTFKYQRVYHPDLKMLVPLSDFEEVEEIDAATQENRDYYIGPLLEDDVAQRLANGELNPKTLELYAIPSPNCEGTANDRNSGWADDKPTNNYYSQRPKKTDEGTRKAPLPLPKGQPSLFDMARTKKKKSVSRGVSTPAPPTAPPISPAPAPAVPGMFTLTDLQAMKQHVPHRPHNGTLETERDSCARATDTSHRTSATTNARASIRDMFSFGANRHTDTARERKTLGNAVRTLHDDVEPGHTQSRNVDDALTVHMHTSHNTNKLRQATDRRNDCSTTNGNGGKAAPSTNLNDFRYNRKGVNGNGLFSQQSSFEAMERLPLKRKEFSDTNARSKHTNHHAHSHREPQAKWLTDIGGSRHRGGKSLDYIDEDEGEGGAIEDGYYTTVSDEEAEKLKHIAMQHSKRFSLPLRKMGSHSVQQFPFDCMRKSSGKLPKRLGKDVRDCLPPDEADKENMHAHNSNVSHDGHSKNVSDDALYTSSIRKGEKQSDHSEPDNASRVLDERPSSTDQTDGEPPDTLVHTSSLRAYTSPPRVQQKTQKLRHGLSRPPHSTSDNVRVRSVVGQAAFHMHKEVPMDTEVRSPANSDAASVDRTGEIRIGDSEANLRVNGDTFCMDDSGDDTTAHNSSMREAKESSYVLPPCINRHTMPLQALEQDRLDRATRNGISRVPPHSAKPRRGPRGLPKVSGSKRPKTVQPKSAGTLLHFAFKPKPRVKGTV